MIVVLCTFLVLLAVPTIEQDSGSTPISPCPDVFMYELPRTEPLRWYGVINLFTDITLHSLWINIIFDDKVEILGEHGFVASIMMFVALHLPFFVDLSNELTIVTILRAFRFNNFEEEVNRRIRLGWAAFEKQRNTFSSHIPHCLKTKVFDLCMLPLLLLRNWFGRVTTRDNKKFKIENRKVHFGPGRALPLRFFVEYKEKPPRLVAIRLNGRDICIPGKIQKPVIWVEQEEKPVPDLTTAYTNIGNPLDIFVNKNLRTLKYPKRTNPEGIDGKPQCGKVVANTTVPNGESKLETRWPWQIALYKDEGMGKNNYACGGTLITARHVITAAHCVTMKSTKLVVDQVTLSVFLGKHNLWTSSYEVLIRFVTNIIVHPEYNASTYSSNVAIFELHRPVKYTDWVKPACLWPKNDIDLKNIIGKKGLLLSWNYDNKDKVIDDLNQEEVPVVSQATCINSHERMVLFTSENTYCAGNRREISSCASAGSGMVFKLGSTWYLRGLASLAIPGYNGKRCDPLHYVIFTDLAKFLPWINSIVFDF